MKKEKKSRQDYMKEYMRTYRRENPDKIREINKRYWKKRLERESEQETRKAV